MLGAQVFDVAVVSQVVVPTAVGRTSDGERDLAEIILASVDRVSQLLGQNFHGIDA